MRAERAGDAAAYERLLRELADALRGIVRSRLPRVGLYPQEEEDIVQEVLIGLHLMRDRWDPARPFLPWLHAIVKYKLIDAARCLVRERRRQVDLDPYEWQSLIDEHSLLELSSVEIERALDSLPDGQRRVASALAVEGVSVRDTALRMSTSEGAIRVIFHRALKALFARAGDAGPVPRNDGHE